MQSPSLRAILRQGAPRPLCKACIRRQFSSSPSVLVHRPQVPYDLPKPQVDPYGFPIREGPDAVDEDSEDDPAWRRRVADSEKEETIESQLRKLAEPTRLGFYERYGSHDGYGLKNKDRWRVNEEGKLEKWEAAGADWKARLGFRSHAFRPGGRVEVIGFQHRKSPKLPVNYSYQPQLDTPWGKKIESVEAIHDPFLQLAEDHVAPRRIDRASPPHLEASTHYAKEAINEKGRQARRMNWEVNPDTTHRADNVHVHTGDCKDNTKREEFRLDNRRRPAADRLSSETTAPRLKEGSPWHLTMRRSYSTHQHRESSRGPENARNGHIVKTSAVVLEDKRSWRPNKKLTYSAMAGVRALHDSDPVKYDRKYLAKHFGISYEGVTRILKSRWRDKAGTAPSEPVPAGIKAIEEKSISGTKWDRRPETSPKLSVLHALRQS